MRHLVIGHVIAVDPAAHIDLGALKHALASVRRRLIKVGEIQTRHGISDILMKRAEVTHDRRRRRHAQDVVRVFEVLIEPLARRGDVEPVAPSAHARIVEARHDDVDDVAGVLDLIVQADHLRCRNAAGANTSVDKTPVAAARQLIRAPVDEGIVEADAIQAERLVDFRGVPLRREDTDDLTVNGARRDAAPRFRPSVRQVTILAKKLDRRKVADHAEVVECQRT